MLKFFLIFMGYFIMVKILWYIKTLFLGPFLGSLGTRCYIGPPLYISELSNVFLGNRVRIYPGARIESLGGAIDIGSDTSVGQNLHLISSSRVTIGKKTTISANVFISDTDHSYESIGVHIMLQPIISKVTTISEGCFIGYGAVILPGTFLGKQCVVGANSVVRGTFPDYSVIAGNPAIIIKRYDFNKSCWRRTDIVGDFIDHEV